MKTLIKFKQFVDEITASDSRTFKENVLKKYKDDEDIKYYLNFVFNPYIVTGISDKKIEKLLNIGMMSDWFSPPIIKDILERVKIHNTGTDDVLSDIRNYYEGILEYDDDVLAKLFLSIISKNLQLGIDAKTINKCIPNLIPTFNVMLANKYFEHSEYVEGKEFAITTKIDGMRCTMLKENGKVTFSSRQGQPIDGLVDLAEEAKGLPDDIAVDGELVAIANNPDTYKDTMKRARTKNVEKHGLKMKVFDLMTAEEFRNQNCKTSYTTRRSDLIVAFSRLFKEEAIKRGNEFAETHPNYIGYIWRNDQIELINSKYTYFEILPILYQGTDTSKIIELLEEQTSKGEEGVMINIVDAPYEFKRTNNLLKVKKFQDTEVKVIGFEPGINRLSDTLGALICEYKGNTVKVGSGFSDELRATIWADRAGWLNKVITVKYFEESYDSKTGLKSLRFPIFMRVREDI